MHFLESFRPKLSLLVVVCFQVSVPFPEEGLVYDYRLDDAGITLPAQDEDVEEGIKKQTVGWKNWMDDLPEFTTTPEMKFSDIIVPTLDTVRSAFVLQLLLSNSKTVRS